MRYFLLAMSFLFMAIPVFGEEGRDGIVYYLDFDIGLEVPLSEDTIEHSGDLLLINKRKFLSLLNDNRSQLYARYRYHDTRAKIVFPGETPYFISRQGVVRNYDDFYSIDKKAFRESLREFRCCDLSEYSNTGVVYSFPQDEVTESLFEFNILSCLSWIDRETFFNMFMNKEPNIGLATDYRHSNVKAKVVFPGESRPYFVDATGIVRRSDDYYVIDPLIFDNNIELVGCPDD
jgi:hypothetical protein